MFKPKFNKVENDYFFKTLKRKCITAFVLTAMFVVSVTTVYAVPQTKKITIIDDGREVSVLTTSSTVKGAMRENGLSISQDDEISPSLKSLLFSGMTISIDRSRKVYLSCDGINTEYTTMADTFREFLNENNITLSGEDTINVDLNAKIPEECSVKITRVRRDVVEVTEAVPYTSSSVNDSNLTVGETRISQYGVPGSKQVQYEVKYVDGELVSTNYVGEYVSVTPVNEIVSVGTKPKQLTATVGGHTFNYKKVITCNATAYDLSFESTGKRPGSPGYGLTASGTYAKVGTVAVDPKVIPLGTKMYIVSTDGSIVYGYCTAEDTGGAIKGNKVDLFYNTTAECLRFGRRDVYVYIL